MRSTIVLVASAFAASAASAQTFDLVSGQTSVLLDTDTLAAAASLDLSSVSADAIAPGSLGANSVAFGINARDAASLPTSFSYDAGLTSFSGSIEHTGTVLFNNDTVVVGNFSIAYDAGRIGGERSGFFVESTTGISAILFDIAVTSVTADSSLIIGADLLVSDEFGGFLFDNGFASSNLAGADVGDALVEGVAVPTPGVAAVFGLGGLLATRRRRS